MIDLWRKTDNMLKRRAASESHIISADWNGGRALFISVTLQRRKGFTLLGVCWSHSHKSKPQLCHFLAGRTYHMSLHDISVCPIPGRRRSNGEHVID